MPPHIHRATLHFVDTIYNGGKVSAEAIREFGLVSPPHYAALATGICTGDISVEQLNAAIGNGIELTALARGVKHSPFSGIIYETCHDSQNGRHPYTVYSLTPSEPELEQER